MFRSKTVFVLGAGASAEVGLPVGKKLLEQISRLIDIRYDHFQMVSGDHLISQALKVILDEGGGVINYNEHLQVAWQVISSANQALSIDNIVDSLEDSRVELVAKLGIARAIHAAEGNSAFFKPVDRDPLKLNYSKFGDSWYTGFTNLICENRRKSELEKVFENLSIVSFNYDRCIENYLPKSIANYYGVEVRDVLPYFQSVPIHRPYGIAGKINWDHMGVAKGFGGNRADYLVQSANSIRTYSEGVENPKSLASMRLDLAEADKIIFLGLAFHRPNLELLEAKVKKSVQVFATSGNISDPDLEVINSELRAVFSMNASENNKQLSFAKMHCKEFFETYWRSLTA